MDGGRVRTRMAVHCHEIGSRVNGEVDHQGAKFTTVSYLTFSLIPSESVPYSFGFGRW